MRASQRLSLVIVSICWGCKGPDGKAIGHEVLPQMRAFAREMVDSAGVNVIHGHGTGHMLGVEVRRRPLTRLTRVCSFARPLARPPTLSVASI